MKSLSNQIKRDIKALLLTIILYLPIIFWWQNNNLPKPIINKVENKTLLNLSTFKPEPIYETSLFEDDTLDDLDDIMSEKIIEQPKKIVKKEEKVLSKKPKPIVHKKKIVKKRRKKIVSKHKSKSKSKKVQKKYTKKTISKKVNSSQFLSKLKNRINGNKRYPKMAKKRGLGGEVYVSFKITKNGKVSNISIKGSKIFSKSAKEAIKKSFPMDTKGINLPINIKLTLIYRIK